MIESMSQGGVLIVDLGGQYTHLISRRFRELGAYTAVVPLSDLNDVDLPRYSAVVLSGSPLSVGELDDEKLYRLSKVVINGSKPVLGICFGHQLIAKLIGGLVEKKREFGRTAIRLLKCDPLFDGWNESEYVWMSHNDCVTSLPSNTEVVAISNSECIAALKTFLNGKVVYGVQFHPEVKHTEKGTVLLENFLNIVKVNRSWVLDDYVEEAVRELSVRVDLKAKALVAVSGGIDSAVAALIAKKVFGERLIGVFVNHGLLREGENEEVLNNLRNAGLDPVYINAEERFLKVLEGVSDCEERRRLIGEEFVKIFKELMERDPEIKYFVQGTTYPDVIESGATKESSRIKTHHNVGGIPEWFDVEILEPLRHLYKDEVRKLSRRLGLPETMLRRHPFPGPGLAVRIIGTFNREKLELARKASKIVEDTLKEHGIYDSVWQAFAVVGDDTWVGVKGDKRDQGYVITIRIVESSDGMTADWVRIPPEILDLMSRRITSSLNRVTMVTYAITSKPPSTIEPC
ncbi:MAG: glutamine-hydrolyzing GMP synthase [Zestosphaera sp.]